MFALGKRYADMRNIIYDDDSRLIGWAREVIGCQFRGDAKAIGLESDGRLVAVTVFDGFSECDCNMHVASDGSGHWLGKDFLTCSFAYPFVQLKLRRVTGLVPAKNVTALRFDLHLGFKHEGICRDALPDDDIIILGMLRAECRFIPKQYRS